MSLAQYDNLRRLILEDRTLLRLICSTTDSCDGDKISKLLYYLYESEGKTMLLLEETISAEIESCSQHTLLFRNNSICSKIMTVWARTQGTTYLKNAVGKCIDDLCAGSDTYEVDANRTTEEININENMAKLSTQVEKFFDSIVASSENCPLEFKKVCGLLQTLAVKKFPDAKYTVVAGFLFLRFICPAIVTPPSYNLTKSFPKKESHRGLVLIAKVLQNLANGVDFKKEPYMMPLSGFLTANEERFKKFIDVMSNPDLQASSTLPNFIVSEADKVSNITEFHDYLSKNIARITETISSKPGTPEALSVNNLKEKLQQSSQGQTNKQISDSASLEVFHKDSVLNGGRTWDNARDPIVVSIDLLQRARKLCESNPVLSVSSKNPTHPYDWQSIAESVDFKEFELDAAELQKVNISQLTDFKEALCFWMNIHNLLCIHAHIVNGPPSSKAQRKSLTQTLKYDIAMQHFNLDDIVEGVLRGNPKGHFKKKDPRCEFCLQGYDPRTHFGVTLLTTTSPQVRVFRPTSISLQLILASEQFLREQVTISEEKKKVKLPNILDKYYDDFGVHRSDIFKWLAMYLDHQTCQQIGFFVSTTHYGIEYHEFNWEPRKIGIFVDDNPSLSRKTGFDIYNSEFPKEEILKDSKEKAEENPKAVEEMGVLNNEVIWKQSIENPNELVQHLLKQIRILCSLFLFDWASIAASDEFKYFVLGTCQLQKVDVEKMSFQDSLVFWINSYNLLLTHMYITKLPPGEKSVFGRKHFFSEFKYNVGGLSYSLDDIRFGILRGNTVHKQIKKKDARFRFMLRTEPRVVFTLSLLTKSSPPINMYEPHNYESSLTKVTQSFIRSHTKIDEERREITLPHLLKEVYEVDFRKKKEELMLWVAQFFNIEQKKSMDNIIVTKKKFSLKFEEFEWEVYPAFDF